MRALGTLCCYAACFHAALFAACQVLLQRPTPVSTGMGAFAIVWAFTAYVVGLSEEGEQ